MLELSVVDLLCEGKYAELMVTRPRTGSDLVTWVWASYMTGTMLAACIIGPVADALSPNVLFYICIPLALQVCTRVLFVCPQLTPPQILWPALRGYLPETQLPAGERGVRWDKFRKQPQLFYLAAVMALAALGLVFVNLFLSLLAQVSTVGVCLSQLLSALNTNPAESFVHRPLNCSPSTVCPQLFALNCLPSTVCPQLSTSLFSLSLFTLAPCRPCCAASASCGFRARWCSATCTCSSTRCCMFRFKEQWTTVSSSVPLLLLHSLFRLLLLRLLRLLLLRLLPPLLLLLLRLLTFNDASPLPYFAQTTPLPPSA